MLRPEDNVGGFRGDAGQEQPPRAGPEHALHTVIICQSKNSQTKSLNMFLDDLATLNNNNNNATTYFSRLAGPTDDTLSPTN